MGRRRLTLLLACLGVLVLVDGSARASTATPVNGRLLIATGTHADASLDGLDLRTGDRLHLVPFGGTVRGAYSPDGTVYVTGSTTSSNLATDGSALNGDQDAFLANVGSFVN